MKVVDIVAKRKCVLGMFVYTYIRYADIKIYVHILSYI